MHCFYRGSPVRSTSFAVRFPQLDVAAEIEVEQIVDWMSEILFTAEIAFRGLDGCMTQQELNLLKFSPAAVAQLRTGSPQVVRCDMLQARSLTAGLDHVPDHIL